MYVKLLLWIKFTNFFGVFQNYTKLVNTFNIINRTQMTRIITNKDQCKSVKSALSACPVAKYIGLFYSLIGYLSEM